MSSGFCHLHVHTHYSALDGACKVEDLVARAAELGMIEAFLDYVAAETGGATLDASQVALYHWTSAEVWQSRRAADRLELAEFLAERHYQVTVVDAGNKPGKTTVDNAELREANKRIRLLEQENEVLRRAAAYLSQANLSPKGSSR